MRKIKINKKGSIGETLNWTVAFIIIVGLMFFYIVTTGFIAGKKKISFGVEENKITYDAIASANSLRTLNSFLIEEVTIDGEKIKVEDGVKQWGLLKSQDKNSEANDYRKKIMPEIGKVLYKYPGKCRILYSSSKDNEAIFSSGLSGNNQVSEYINNPDTIVVVNNNDETGGLETPIANRLRLIKHTKIIINDKNLYVKFYSGDQAC
ncbi:hypothetical protein COU57_03735 [Candidatus Pacearchaeota archaeon CG10_big_fil_rev_8_21_14_0_10_32_14]|nr:MAG: hypothetical protein COU57_03735 [Candidatus Pacearchaeota archaeon CG10_big_fil_rev_8_21_14_0_10_32_14]